MKLTTEKTEVTRSQEFETKNYGVDASNLPLLFQLLRTNLYSDLHGSIVRELVSNVIDSHTEAGKPGTIGEVEWIAPSKILGVDCQLIIRDFGVGLSPERMSDVYGNYLSSTKRGDNSAIGGFGLGSKVPFAYTDSFSVQTVYNGIKYRYLCYIDETQLGAISLLTKEETTLQNQTEVIIPIKDDVNDHKLFQEAISTQLGYFNTIKYIGFDCPDPVIRFENEYCIVKEEAPIAALHVVLGNVAYPIDFKALGILEADIATKGYKNCGVGLKFSIGELQPTMSRENLNWTPATKERVLAKIEKAKRSIKQQIEIELGQEKDYAKWYAYVSAGQSASFPGQFTFANVKRTAEMDWKGKKLPVQVRQEDWFAGHSVRKVTPYYGGRRRNSTTVTPEYETGKPQDSDFLTLPIYQIERNLSASTCLFLFRSHNAFIVVGEVGQPDSDDCLENNYEATKEWAKTLPSYDDLDVPDDAPDSTVDEQARRYRELVKARKLEGKFTAKKMRMSYDSHRNMEDAFIYNMYEGKFQDSLKKTIIYGFQDDHKNLCKVAGMLMLSKDFTNRLNNEYDPITKSHKSEREILVLKISQQYEKQFFAMPNAHNVDDVLALDTPLKETFASIATALRIKPFIHEYHSLQFFDHINKEMKNRYAGLHKFVEDYSISQTFYDDASKKILQLCGTTILNQEMETEWQRIQEYFDGANLLKNVNFAMYSKEHTGSNGSEGTIAYYLRQWVHQSEPFIKDYLISKCKQVDGGPAFPEKQPAAVLAIEPDVVIKATEELEEVSEIYYDLTS